MRALISRRSGWAGLCAILFSGCSSLSPVSSPSSSSVDGNLPGSSGSVLVTQSSATSTSSSAASPAPVTTTDTEDTNAGSVFDNLDVVDSSLQGKLAILRVGSEQSANDLLSVFAGLKNRTERRLNLEVETIYKDKTGGALNSGSWISVTLRPHEEKEYRSTSISDQATDFLVQVRRAAPAP
jgi:hypothetical protein